MRSAYLLGMILVTAIGPAALNAADAASPETEAVLEKCPPFAVVKRHHFRKPFGLGTLYCWNVFTPGGAICIVDPARPDEPPREIFRRDDGVVFDMNVSFDAQKLLFSWMRITRTADDPQKPTNDNGEVAYRGNPDSFHIYEINVDGSGLRQITTGRFHDVYPIYLPDGRIAFTSTRGKSYSMCQPGLSSALFTSNPDGSDIRRIEFSTLAGASPHLLDDGSILFTRWEYLDKSLFTLQSLWTINPNGTRLQLFYGNTITNPNVIWQTKPIPGTDRMLCTLGPHHGNPVGAIGILDRRRGLENPAALVNITPEFAFTPSKQVHAGGGPGDKQYNWAYRDPWPVNEDLFLVAYGGTPHDKQGRYCIYSLDPSGHRVKLLEDAELSCFNPVPLVPRKTPRVIAPLADTKSDFGTFFVSDVYLGLLDNGIERGQVKEIRIMTQVPKRCNMRGHRIYDHDPVVSRGSYYVKTCFGTVPVEDDGSAYFKAPAGVELYFEAVDADGKEISRMGSTTQIMPGEHQSCVGCHEPRLNTAIHAGPPKTAVRRKPSEITPPPWGTPGPVDFVRHVQPVLDRYCAKCHGGEKPDGGLDLSGDKTRFFNMAYEDLLRKNLVHYIYINRGLTDNFLPMTTGSHVSRLTEFLENGHGKVNVPDRDRRSIYTWIDANCPYYGTYDNTRPGTAGSRDLWSGAWMRSLHEALDSAVAARGTGGKRPRIQDGDINLTHPEFSRVLIAHLAKSAGGLAEDEAALFDDRADPNFQAALAALRAGKQALDDKPRVDMPGAKPVPYPVDYGGLYTGFAGP